MSHEDPRSGGSPPHVFDFDDPWDEPMPSWLDETAAPLPGPAGNGPVEPAMQAVVDDPVMGTGGGAGGAGDTGVRLFFDDLGAQRGPAPAAAAAAATATRVLNPPVPTAAFEPVTPPDTGTYRGDYRDRRRYLPLLALGALVAVALVGVLVRAVSGSDDPEPARTTSSQESGRRVDPTRASSGGDGTVTPDAAVLGAVGAGGDPSGLGGQPSGGGGGAGSGTVGGGGGGAAGSGGGGSTPAGGEPGSPGGGGAPGATGSGGGGTNPSSAGNGTRSVSNSQVSTNGAPASSHSVATGGGSSGPAPGSGSPGSGGGSSSSPPTGSSGGGTPSGSSSSGVSHNSSGVSSSNSSSSPGT